MTVGQTSIRWHTDSKTCDHTNDNVCPFCDFDGYYESTYPTQCPWAKREVEAIDELDHTHDDDCRTCGRDGCPELNCQHEDGEHGCTRPGCLCARWLAAGDCPTCDGYGAITLDYELLNGAVREYDAPCRDCDGTGCSR